jgi:putative protein kinase ArgK-like GTPase of G3E family
VKIRRRGIQAQLDSQRPPLLDRLGEPGPKLLLTDEALGSLADHLELMLDLSHVTGAEDPTGRRPPIVMTTATEGRGAGEVWDEIEAHARHLRATGGLEARRADRLRAEILSRIDQSLQARARENLATDSGREVLERVVDRDLSPTAAGEQIITSMLR